MQFLVFDFAFDFVFQMWMGQISRAMDFFLSVDCNSAIVADFDFVVVRFEWLLLDFRLS